MATRARAALAEVPGVRGVEERPAATTFQAFSVSTDPGVFTVEVWRRQSIANLTVVTAVAERDAVAMLRDLRAAVPQREPAAQAAWADAFAVLMTHVGAVQAHEWLLAELLALGEQRAPANGGRAWDPRIDAALAVGEELRALAAATTGPHPPVALPPEFKSPLVAAEPLLVLQLRALQGRNVAATAQPAVDEAWRVVADPQRRVQLGLAWREIRQHLVAAAEHLRGVAASGRDPVVAGQALRIARCCDDLIAGIGALGTPW